MRSAVDNGVFGRFVQHLASRAFFWRCVWRSIIYRGLSGFAHLCECDSFCLLCRTLPENHSAVSLFSVSLKEPDFRNSA